MVGHPRMGQTQGPTSRPRRSHEACGADLVRADRRAGSRARPARLIGGRAECYTEAVTAAINATGPSESANEFARVRATRQERLTGPEPLRLWAILDEAVLHRKVGGPGVMREQLARLIDAASQQPTITVQVLPFSAGAHPGMTGPFTILRFAEESMNMVYLEQRGGAVYLERPVDVEVHEATFRRLSDLALSEDDTISLLNKIETRH
jgi:hypothetical protein